MGEARPRGELKNELAVVDDSGPNDYDSEETLSWTRGKSMSLVDTESATHGWGVTITQGYEIGGEAAGGKYIGGIELAANGEYSKGKAEENADSWDVTKSTKIDLPKLAR